MAHVIPTLRSASRAMYTLPAVRRNPAPSDANESNPGDFRNILKDQAAPAASSPAAPTGTIGTVTPWSPSPAISTPAAATTSPMAPTAQSLFGANPWSSTAGGSGPYGDYSYNKYYFATPATAAKVAQMLGGTVVATDAITPCGPFKQNQPNLMVQMPNGKMINAGLVAGFYDHGYTQQAVDQMIASEVGGDLG